MKPKKLIAGNTVFMGTLAAKTEILERSYGTCRKAGGRMFFAITSSYTNTKGETVFKKTEIVQADTKMRFMWDVWSEDIETFNHIYNQVHEERMCYCKNG